MISGAVWPLLVRLAEDMNAQRRGVVQRWYGGNFRVEFKDIRPEDKEAQAAELKSNEPFYTLNELREMTGKEAFAKDDPRGMMLVAEIAKGAPLPGTPAAKLLEEAQAAKEEAEADKQVAAIEAGEMEEPGVEGDGEPLPDGIAPEEEAMPVKSVFFKDLLEEHKASGDPYLNEDPSRINTILTQQFATDDLKRWEAKALHDFKAKGRVWREFNSDTIPPDDMALIRVLLKDAQTAQEVKAAFRGVDIDAHAAEAVQWAQEAME